MSLQRTIFCLLLFLTAASPVRAQTAEPSGATAKRLAELEEQITIARSRLSDTQQLERSSTEDLEQLNREIALREELARTYRARLRELSFASDSLQRSLLLLQQNADVLMKQYQSRAVHAYKYGRLHDLALILAAESINQMLIRARYLQRFGDERAQKLNEVLRVRAALESRQQQLESTHRETEQLLAKAEDEERMLTRLRRDRSSLVAHLRQQRTELQQELEQKQSEQEALQTLMRRLNREETLNRETAAAADPSVRRDFEALSGSFQHNQGRLPWPVIGAVQEGFGNRMNPVLGTITTNPGILIATRPAADVHAIFDGDVILVDAMPDFGTLVTISHGAYKSVYSNLSTVLVHKGDHLRAGQVVGRAGTKSEPKGAGLFFGLFKNGIPVDPLAWLRPE